MSDRILLLEPDPILAEKLIHPLRIRGWMIDWIEDLDVLRQARVEGIYLLSLAHPNLDARDVCQWLRAQPKGENASIFLLNDGSQKLRTFEEALQIGADGLFFTHNQLPLLLANFPPKHTFSSAPEALGYERSTNAPASLHSRGPQEPQRSILNSNRVEGISLAHIHKERQSIGYNTSSDLMRSQIERALREEANARSLNMQKAPSEEPYDHAPRSISHSSRSSESTPQLSISPRAQPKSHRPAARSISHVTSPPSSSATARSTPIFETSISRSKPPMSQPSLNQSSHSAAQNLSPIPRANLALSSPPHFSRETPPSSLSQTSATQHHFPWGNEAQLSEIEFAQYFVYAYSSQKTLTLTVQTDRVAWILTLSEGHLTNLTSSHQDEVLLTQILAQGMITPHTAERARYQEIDDLIEWLIDEGDISFRDLQRALREVTERQLKHLFGLTEGTITTSEYHRPRDPISLGESEVRLSIQSIFETYGRLRLYEVFGTLKSTPTTSGTGLYRGGLAPEELGLLQGARGQRSVSDLANDVGVDPLYALSVFHVFSLLGEVQLESNSPFTGYLERISEMDYFQILSLEYDVSAQDVSEAWRRHRQWVSEQGDPQDQEVKELIDVLNDAYQVLVYDSVRNQYLQSLHKPIYAEEQRV